MDLFLIDRKHQQVHGKLELMYSELVGAERVIEFLKKHKVIDGRYNDLVIATDVKVEYEDGEPNLVIQ